MTWRKKFNIDNKGNDDLRPGQRMVVYYGYKVTKLERPIIGSELENWLWNLTPDEFEDIMNWSLE